MGQLSVVEKLPVCGGLPRCGHPAAYLQCAVSGNLLLGRYDEHRVYGGVTNPAQISVVWCRCLRFGYYSGRRPCCSASLVSPSHHPGVWQRDGAPPLPASWWRFSWLLWRPSHPGRLPFSTPSLRQSYLPQYVPVRRHQTCRAVLHTGCGTGRCIMDGCTGSFLASPHNDASSSCFLGHHHRARCSAVQGRYVDLTGASSSPRQRRAAQRWSCRPVFVTTLVSAPPGTVALASSSWLNWAHRSSVASAVDFGA